MEELVPIVLNDKLLDPVIYIRSLLNLELCEGLIQFLKENQDVFMWCHDDMSSIDYRIMSHRLNLNSDLRLVKKKRKAMALERQNVVNEEVRKLLKVGSIREV